MNSSKYRKASNFSVGQTVLVRNFKKASKFQPVFMDDLFEIVDVENKSKKLKLKLLGSDSTLVRHPDDVKPYHGNHRIVHAPDTDQQAEDIVTEEEEIAVRNAKEDAAGDTSRDAPGDAPGGATRDETRDATRDAQEPVDATDPDTANTLRRSDRRRAPNTRYINNDFVSK